MNKFSRKLPFKSSPFLPLLAVVIIIGSIPWEPWCGRLFFQFYQPSKSRELIETDQTAQWLTDNFSSINNCYFVTDGELASFTKWRTKQLGDSKVCVYLTDPVTAFGLSAHFGKHYWMERLKPRKFGVLSDRCQEIIDVFASAPYENSNVGVLIPIESEIPQLERSASADLSHHWLQMHSDITKNSINLGEIENCFLSHNWKSIEVPPYYKLLIPRE